MGKADGGILTVWVVEIDVVEVVEVGVSFGLGCGSEQRGCKHITVEVKAFGGVFNGAVGSNEQADDAHIIIIVVFVQCIGKIITGRLSCRQRGWERPSLTAIVAEQFASYMVVGDAFGGDGVGQVFKTAHRAVAAATVRVGLVVGRSRSCHTVFGEDGRKAVVTAHVLQCSGCDGGGQLACLRVVFADDV